MSKIKKHPSASIREGCYIHEKNLFNPHLFKKPYAPSEAYQPPLR